MKKTPSKITRISAGGGVVFRDNPADPANPFVLLILRNGLWDLPKGKQEPGEGMEECARREVSEELNAPRPEIVFSLPGTCHEYLEPRDGIYYGKTTHWYAMQFEGEPEFSPQKEEGITEIKWHLLHAAAQRVAFQNLKEVLAAFAASYKDFKAS